MAAKIRVLDAANRTMQRLGYLKLLCARAAMFETSNLSTLGHHLVETVTKRVRLQPPLSVDLKHYVRIRLTDRTYHDLRKRVLEANGSEDTIWMEIQDTYLADSGLPSRTGKLVAENWKRYPYWATAIDLVKKGVYSALTRSLVLMNLTPRSELEAFERVDDDSNPFRLSRAQALFFLYCLLDNDAEVLFPFWSGLLERGNDIPEKDAGQLLPPILRQVDKKYSRRILPREDRDRLAVIRKVADSIESWKKREDTGGGAVRENVTVRLEPYCDIGLFTKPDRDRYEYRAAPCLSLFVKKWGGIDNTEIFLAERFFAAAAACWKIAAEPAEDDEATAALEQANEALRSPLGYAPIVDMGLLAGLRLLTEHGRILELQDTTDLLKRIQKQRPDYVRFTVDRMGRTAYAKFLKPAATSA